MAADIEDMEIDIALQEEEVIDVEVNEEDDFEIDIDEVVEDNEEMSDSDAILSDDSCYDSDMRDVLEEEIYLVLNQAEVNTLNTLKKMCVIQFYYMDHHAKFCSSCIVNFSDLFSCLRAIRKHDTDSYIFLDGSFCSECRNPLFQIMPCNLCPICTK